jgi:hypothetical protein
MVFLDFDKMHRLLKMKKVIVHCWELRNALADNTKPTGRSLGARVQRV